MSYHRVSARHPNVRYAEMRTLRAEIPEALGEPRTHGLQLLVVVHSARRWSLSGQVPRVDQSEIVEGLLDEWVSHFHEVPWARPTQMLPPASSRPTGRAPR